MAAAAVAVDAVAAVAADEAVHRSSRLPPPAPSKTACRPMAAVAGAEVAAAAGAAAVAAGSRRASTASI